MNDVRVRTTTAEDGLIPAASVADLRGRLRGELLIPGDAGYQEARTLWNAMCDLRPGFIARCAGVSDVIAAVNFARAHRLPLAVRGGGHNVSGSASCDGGMMLDMSRLKSVRVDPEGRTARAEPGLTWGEFDRETQAFGLATTGGICSQAGIAGVTLGGGFGWLMRKHGLALDNLLSLDVVNADGQLRTASATVNPDLFFGLRGTHSNLGVVTSLEYRLHPVGPVVMAGMVLHPLERGKEALRFYREYTSQAPEEMSAWAALLSSPDGHPMVAILACYIGAAELAEQVVAPLRKFGPPVADMIGPMPYVKAQSLIDASFPYGRCHYWKSNLLSALSGDAIDTLVDGFGKVTSPYSSVLVEHLGGAVSRAESGETAFGHRSAPYDMVIMPSWIDPQDSKAHIQWADALLQSMQPFSSGGVYVNYLSNEGEDRVKAAYGTQYARLAKLKEKYDPLNLFCCNQNIKPIKG